MSEKEIIIKSQSRFVEHFDMMPPTELLDTIIGEEKEKQQRESGDNNGDRRVKKPTPLYSLPLNSSNSATRSVLYSPTSPTSPKPIIFDTSISHDIPNVPSAANIKMAGNNSPLPNIQQQQELQHHNPTSTTAKKLHSLNRADIIIKRYESWSKFILLLYSWINEIARISIQSERSYQTLLDNDKFSNLKGNNIETANGIHANMHGFTMDLALQEQKFGRNLQAEQLPILEKFKKECHFNIKSLKSRLELGLEEFLKRAELTANLITQLNKTCKEARRTIEKGAQVMNDPWLVNLCKVSNIL